MSASLSPATDFILIHGACHGAWCWTPLIRELEARKARGFACDLPGHGDDRTPRKLVTRQSYIDSVTGFAANLPARRLVLVGHSLAGIILPDIFAALPERIAEVVYLAALVPEPGEQAIDLVPESRRTRYRELTGASDRLEMSVDFETAHRLFLNGCDEAQARRYFDQLTPQPLLVYFEPVGSRAFSCPVRYIVCRQDQTLSPELCLSWAGRLGVKAQFIDSGHDAMLLDPGGLADLLLKRAG